MEVISLSFSENLRRARDRAGLTQAQVADRMGISYSTYACYETDKRKPNPEKIKKLAEILNTSADALLDTEAYAGNTGPMPGLVQRPRLGAIACGDPILAEQNIEGYDQVPDYIKCDFTLVCRGDSMIGARIYDGDIVCIRQQAEVENGQIAAVLVNGEEATLKRFYFTDGVVTLQAENPAYPPRVFTGEDVENVRVLGLATHFISTIR